MVRSNTSVKQPQTLHAIIVRLQNYREADRILDVVTHEMGRLSLLARGARASKRRFAGVLDQFVTVRLQALPASGLWTLHSADLLAARVGIRAGWEHFSRASLLAECARVVAPEAHACPDVFQALSDGLDLLHAGQLVNAVSAYAPILADAGLLPDMSRCAQCHERLGSLDSIGLLNVDAGVICTRCSPNYPQRGTIARGAAIARVLAGEACPDEAVATACEGFAIMCLERHIGHPLRSRVALAQ